MDQNGNVTSHLSGILYRTSSIVEKGIKPIYVFDGKHSDFKTATVEKRKEIREESEKEWICVYVEMIYFAVSLKLTQCCKSTIFQ